MASHGGVKRPAVGHGARTTYRCTACGAPVRMMALHRESWWEWRAGHYVRLVELWHGEERCGPVQPQFSLPKPPTPE